MARKPIEIGHVVRLSGEVAGFVVNVSRYGNGRKLPAPRILLGDDGRPFASAFGALEALREWKETPRSCRQLHKTDVVEAPAAPAPKPAPVKREVKPARPSRKIKRANTPLPAIRKLMPERPTQIVPDRRTKMNALIDMLLTAGQATVTRCEEFQRRNLSPRRGGVLPGHLNPVTVS